MADYTVPTSAQLKANFPAFATVDDGVVTDRIGEASNRVDTTWSVDVYAKAIMLLACHLLTIDGFGTGTQSDIANLTALGYQTLKSGSFTLSGPRISAKAGVSSPILQELSTTSYGRRFTILLRLNSPAALVV